MAWGVDNPLDSVQKEKKWNRVLEDLALGLKKDDPAIMEPQGKAKRRADREKNLRQWQGESIPQGSPVGHPFAKKKTDTANEPWRKKLEE